MATDLTITNKSLSGWAAPAVWVAAALLLFGCANNYGHMIRDPEVTIAFKTNRAFDDHTYYFRDWLAEPIAVVGIRQGYTLDSALWYEVDLDTVSIQLLWDRMSRRNPSNFYGSILKDPAGNDMGVWFSDFRGATIKMKSPTVIDFITPYSQPPAGDSASRRPVP